MLEISNCNETHLNYYICSSVNYSDFEYDGKKVFENMEPVHTDIAFMKKKFFQVMTCSIPSFLIFMIFSSSLA